MFELGWFNHQPDKSRGNPRRENREKPPSWDPKRLDPVASLEGGRWKAKIIQKSPSRKETKIRTPPKNGGLMWFVDVCFLFHLASFSSFLLSCFVLGGWNPLGYTVYMMS